MPLSTLTEVVTQQCRRVEAMAKHFGHEAMAKHH